MPCGSAPHSPSFGDERIFAQGPGCWRKLLTVLEGSQRNPSMRHWLVLGLSLTGLGLKSWLRWPVGWDPASGWSWWTLRKWTAGTKQGCWWLHLGPSCIRPSQGADLKWAQLDPSYCWTWLHIPIRDSAPSRGFLVSCWDHGCSRTWDSCRELPIGCVGGRPPCLGCYLCEDLADWIHQSLDPSRGCWGCPIFADTFLSCSVAAVLWAAGTARSPVALGTSLWQAFVFLDGSSEDGALLSQELSAMVLWRSRHAVDLPHPRHPQAPDTAEHFKDLLNTNSWKSKAVWPRSRLPQRAISASQLPPR